MTLRHLKIFVTVADCGKMRKAAELLYISQPSVSQAISELEQHYGCLVFERLAQKIYLTEQGELLLSYARHLLDSYEKMEAVMKNIGAHPVIRLGGSVSVGTRFFEEIVTKMEQEILNLDIRVVINNTERIETKILKSELDIGIVEGLVKSNDVVKIPVFQDELVVVVGKPHPFYQRKQVALEELEGQYVIAREDASTERNQYENFLAEQGIHLVTKWSSSNIEPIKKAVIAGKGLALLSHMLVEKEVLAGELKIVPVKKVKIEREIHLIYHKDKYISPQLEKLIEIIKDHKVNITI